MNKAKWQTEKQHSSEFGLFWGYTQAVIQKPLYLGNNFETEYTDIFPGSSVRSQRVHYFLKISKFTTLMISFLGASVAFFQLIENSPKTLTKGLLFCLNFSFYSLFYGSL